MKKTPSPVFALPDREGSMSPIFLTSVLGSTAEERRQGKKKSYRSYNKKVRSARKLVSNVNNLLFIIKDPDEFSIKLSQLEAAYPNLSYSLNFNIQDTTKSQDKLLRSLLIWYIFQDWIPEWVQFYLEESFHSCISPERMFISSTKTSKKVEYIPGKGKSEVNQKTIYSEVFNEENADFYVEDNEGNLHYFKEKESIQHLKNPRNIRIIKEHREPYIQYQERSKTYKEILSIWLIYIQLGRSEARTVLEKIYSNKNNLKKWYETGESLAAEMTFIHIQYAIVKETIRRRGYSKSSGSNKNKTRNQEGNIMKEDEYEKLEEVRKRILYKQALLFEQRLDSYLKLLSPDTSKKEARDAFHDLIEPKIGNRVDIKGEDLKEE